MPLETVPEEAVYKWFEAAKSYEEILKSTDAKNPVLMAEYRKKIGHCYSSASRQREDVDSFMQLLHLAISAFEKAAEIHGKISSLESEGEKAFCLALAEYEKSWLASSPTEKL